MYRSGQASPVEAMQAVLTRLSEIDKTLNAFCVVDADHALASAKASEARWRKRAPIDILDGVPVSIKDLILTRGWPTLRGSRTIDPKQTWDVDAPVSARLREAGAVLFGKTNTPEFGIKGTTDNLLTGITRNPWNPRMTPGGSSGGAAAVRHAAESFAALGAEVDELAPGFANPEVITTKLWFVGALMLIDGMTAEQVALTDPALRWQADEGRKVSVMELQKLNLRRGELGSFMRQFHQRYDLLLTPGVAVPAFEAKAPEEWELRLDTFLRWTPFSYPFNLTQQPAAVVP